MKLRADPLVLAVALGFLSPTVFEVEGDLLGETSPPPMLQPLDDGDASPPSAALEPAESDGDSPPPVI